MTAQRATPESVSPASFVSVRLGADTECTVFRSRPALEAFKLDQFELQPGVVLQAAAASDVAPLLPASVLHKLRAAVVKNSTEPVSGASAMPVRKAFWSGCQELQARLQAEGVSALVVPSGVQGTHRGKCPAKHVRSASTYCESERWTLDKATDSSHWFGPGTSECVGLGLFLFSDTIALDFDDLWDEARLEVFERLLPLFTDAPLEFTRNGAHVYFRSTAHSRSVLPFRMNGLVPKVDFLTGWSTQSPSFIAIAPSKNKRFVPGREVGVQPMPPIPDKLVDELVALRAAWKESTGAAGEPEQRPAKRRREGDSENAGAAAEPDHSFLSRLAPAAAQRLFESVGLSHLSGIHYKHGAWFARSEGPCCIRGCTKRESHTQNFYLFQKNEWSMAVAYTEGESKHHAGLQKLKVAPLTPALRDALRTAWLEVNPSRGQDAFELRADGENTWRQFEPWQAIPAATWNVQRQGELLSMPAPWYYQRCFGLDVTEFMGEHGPEGNARHGWAFASTTPCDACGCVHAEPYAVKTYNAIGTLLFRPCKPKGERIGSRGGDGAAGGGDGAAGGDSDGDGARLREMLVAIRDAPDWAAAMDASLVLLDWSYGKPQTWFVDKGFCADTSRLTYAANNFTIFTLWQGGKVRGKSHEVLLHKRHQKLRVGLDDFEHVK